MSILTIILFFIYTYCLGYSVTFFVKNSTNTLEKHLIRVGIGLGIIPILLLFLNLIRIPLDWRILLIISVIIPVYNLYKKISKKEKLSFAVKPTKSNMHILILVFVLFTFNMAMYVKGAFVYPYLEDSDSWNHAVGAKFVSIEKTAYVSNYYNEKTSSFFKYMAHYPPGYEVIMGILHQTSPSMNWTLKFFNSLIISLGIIFFFFFVKELTKSSTIALYSSFVLSMIPSYLSHFIWAHSLIVTLFFPAFYCLERTSKDSKWKYPAALIISSIMVIQPSQAFKFGILFALYWVVKSFYNKDLRLDVLFSGFTAVILSFLIWWLPAINRFGFDNILTRFGLKKAVDIVGVKGTADRIYSFNDFFIAKGQNMINNPIGWGILITLLFILVLIIIFINYKKSFSKKSFWIPICILWFLFTFLGVHGARLPVSLFSFRFWMLLAIPTSILVGYGIYILIGVAGGVEKQFKFKYIIQIILIVVLVFGFWKTSGQQKYQVNTAIWGAGSFWRDPGALQSFVWLKETTPINTKVFAFPRFDSAVIGMDGFSCEWCPDIIQFREEMENKTTDEFHKWIKQNNYEYILLSSYYYSSEYGANATIEKINNLISSNLFKPLFQPIVQGQKSASIVFKIIV